MACSGRLLDTMPPSARLAKGDMDMHLEGVDDLERRLCYKFQDRSFLLQAITHASYSSNRITDCYQRLEFLGDAVIGTAPQTLTWDLMLPNSTQQHEMWGFHSGVVWWAEWSPLFWKIMVTLSKKSACPLKVKALRLLHTLGTTQPAMQYHKAEGSAWTQSQHVSFYWNILNNVWVLKAVF